MTAYIHTIDEGKASGQKSIKKKKKNNNSNNKTRRLPLM